MPFDWNRYATLADEWKESQRQELLRCSISRAYYAFYNSIRIKKGIPTKKQPHKIVIEKLSENNDPEEIELAKLLKDLQEIREIADYDGVQEIDGRYTERFFTRLTAARELCLEILP
jgi:uncharacterized protein (UPF0332 family)